MSKYDAYPVPTMADLLEELCPEGVQQVELREVLKHEQPGKYQVQSTNYDPDAPTPVLSPGKGFVLGYTYEKDGIFPASAESPVIIFDDFTTNFHWVDFPFKVKSSAMKMLHINSELANFRFVYWAMKSIAYRPSEHARQWIQTYSKLQIPLPPPEVQEQVVASLDMFTDLGASLNRELTLREEQLSHYRRSLIAHSVQTNSASFEPVGRIATVGRGKRVVKKDLSATPEPDMSPVFQNSIAPMGYSSDWNVDGGVAFTIIAGSSSGSIGFSDEPFWAADDCLYFEGHDGVDNRYLYHVLLAYNHQLFHHVTKASMPRLHRRYVESLEIPLPPLDVQEQIVDTLDMFTDYTDNLGREIDLRRQQLEYYRGQLLTFPVAE